MARASVLVGLLMSACRTDPATRDRPVLCSPPADTAPRPAGPEETWEVTGQPGELVLIHLGASFEREESVLVAGVFAADLQGLVFPAACLGAGLLCVDHLPADPEAPLQPGPVGFDPDRAGFTWVGDVLWVSGHPIPFGVDGPRAGYRRSFPALPRGGPLELVMDGGQWGAVTLPGAVPVPSPLDLREPDPRRFANLAGGGDLPLRWTPAPSGLLLLQVTGPRGTTLWRLPDDGEFQVPAEAFGAPREGEVLTVDLVRVETLEHDVHGNRLTTRAIAGRRVLAGLTWPVTCADQLRLAPDAPSGVYRLQPHPLAPPVEVWCDLEGDGGGWTLVASSTRPPDDAAAPWSRSLRTLSPGAGSSGVWDGLRPALAASHDLRVACRARPEDPAFTVDLSFYGVDWYRRITAGSDEDTCFFEDDGRGWRDPAPARRDNVGGRLLAAGTPWRTDGYLEGEDACGDRDDFTVDLEDRGMDGEQSDGTDWGEDDGTPKCGVSGQGAAWFVFVR